MLKKYIWLVVVMVGGLLAYLVLLRTNKPPAIQNVILISIDGLQAKHLREYGYRRSTTPNMDKLVDSSYLFLKAVSPASWTVPSHMSIFTSMYPSEHKVVNKFVEFDSSTDKTVVANLKQLTPAAVTLAEVMRESGYATGGFTGDAGVGRQFGFDQGFETYYDAETFGGMEGSIPMALDWLKINKDKKFFLFLHGYDVHGQYVPKEGLDYRYVAKPYTGIYTGSASEQGALRELGLKNGSIELSDSDIDFWRAVYDEKINRADEQFGQFLQQVEDMGLMENTAIVLFSDHGTEFYEHRRFDHGHTLYGELVEVLLAIHLPGQKEGKKIDDLVSTMDIMPTVLNLLQIESKFPEQIKGKNLTPSFAGGEVAHEVYAETDYRLYTHKRAIQTTDGWKYILTLNPLGGELYNLNDDSTEQFNLADIEPKRVYELEGLIYKHMKEMRSAEGPWELGCSPVYGDQCR